MKFCIVSGSHRKNSQSEKIAKYLTSVLSSQPEVTAVHLLNLAGNPLPLFDEDFFSPESEKWKKLWTPYSQKLQESSGIIIISPEWHGMVPAGLKNFLLLCSSKELGHKAGLIVSVSAGLAGTYPISELRTSGCKNSRLCFIPDHIIIRNCNEVLNETQPITEQDKLLRNRIDYTLKVFKEYTKALTLVRESGIIDYKLFPNGM